MGNSINTIQLCQELTQSDKSGCLTVESNGVTWKLWVSQGKLCYANNSAQTLEALNYHLTHMGHEAVVKSLEATPLNPQYPWGQLHYSAQQLHLQGALNREDFTALRLALNEDALEPMLWLTQGTSQWSDIASEALGIAGDEDFPEFLPVLNHLKNRLSSWQNLAPVIRSPFQQPHCPDKERLSQPVANGMLNPGLLAMLARLMEGNSLRKLSLFLKQDSLKVAQLLYPYVQQNVITLRPAEASFNKLPSIPVAIESEPLASSGMSSPSDLALGKPTSSQRKKIVCVDDSPAMLETLEKYLDSEGFEVATVSNPMESLSTLFAMKPDLILMDVSMPGINGNRLCQILRRSSVFKGLPIIMVSGNTGAMDKAKAEASGATDYLTKPFSKAELVELVETHLSAVPV